MFDKLEPLDRKAHKSLRFTPSPNFSFADKLSVSPIAAPEAGEASKSYPLVFSPEGPLVLFALLSLRPDVNAFVDAKGECQGAYVPLHVRRYPFILGQTPKADTWTIMIDRDAPHWKNKKGEPLFGDENKESPVIAQASKLLQGFQRDMNATQRLLQPLADKGVLEKRRFSFNRDGKPVPVPGEFRAVDAKKLAALDDTTLAAWTRNGLMGLVFAHLHTLSNVRRLLPRAKAAA